MRGISHFSFSFSEKLIFLQFVRENKTHIVCACSHLTAFSALVLESSGCKVLSLYVLFLVPVLKKKNRNGNGVLYKQLLQPS